MTGVPILYCLSRSGRFVQVCHRSLVDSSLEPDQFSKELLPSLLTLALDKVPNVRIATAQLFSQGLLPIGKGDNSSVYSIIVCTEGE